MAKTYQLLNPKRVKLAQELRKMSKEKKVKIWERVAEKLGKSEVNLEKINKYTKENDEALVPGKVLGDGNLDHKVRIAAFKFSSQAEKKIKDAGGEILSIKELIQKNPQGSGIKILS